VGTRWVQNLAALGAYSAGSLILFGRRVLPHISDRILAHSQTEASIHIWGLAWWPHALGHAVNPFFTRLVWAPTGVNIAWTTTIPIPALLLSPITIALGPVVAFNVLSLAAPALASWTAFLLCRRISGSYAASLAGGVFFGFSPNLMGEIANGHLNLSLLYMLPVVAYLVVRRLEGSIGRLAFVLLLAPALVVQFGIFNEVFATMTLIGFLVGAFAWVVTPSIRRRIAEVGGLAALSYLVTAVVLIPYLHAMIAYPQAQKPGGYRSIAFGIQRPKDLLTYFLPGSYVQLGHQIGGKLSLGLDPWYFGIPLLALLVTFWVTQWRRPLVKVLAFGFLLSVVLALGPRLPLGGHSIPLPWRLVRLLPLLGRVRPGRIVAFAFLFAAVSVAMWLSEARRPRLRWAVVGLAALTLLPHFTSNLFWGQMATPSFFSDGTYQAYIAPGETVLLVSHVNGLGVVWQAEAGMRFATTAWYHGFHPVGYQQFGIGQRLAGGRVLNLSATALRAFLSDHHVGAIVVGPADPASAAWLVSTLGVPAEQIGGVTLLRPPGGSWWVEPTTDIISAR